MEWLSDVFVLAVLIYLAYQVGKFPEQLDRYVRSLAVEYKRWADRDRLYERIIKHEQNVRTPNNVASLKQRRRTRRLEMNRENDADAFRRVGPEMAALSEQRNEAELKLMDEEIEREARVRASGAERG
jgi:hypothetical protein